jgi:hypothetical protein
LEESTVTTTVKNFSDLPDQAVAALDPSPIMEIRNLLAETTLQSSRPTVENSARQNLEGLPQSMMEMALLRSTINTMKKQGYFLTKNHDYIKQENLILKESNVKLEQLVTVMEERMEKMVKETNDTKTKCEKALFNSMVHESILIERIDGLQKLNK